MCLHNLQAVVSFVPKCERKVPFYTEIFVSKVVLYGYD